MREYGFNILSERKIQENVLSYTEDAQIFQSILDYSLAKGTQGYFTRGEITSKHLFSKFDSKNKLSSHYDVFNNEFIGD